MHSHAPPREGFVWRKVRIGAFFVICHWSFVICWAQPSFRAVWADAFSVGFKSSSQINTLVSRLASGHYNAVFVEVLAFHDTGPGAHGAYWNSAIVPRASDIQGGIDPLAVLVSTAHAAGIEVHAWIVPYRVSSTWPPNGNSFLAAHPEYLMVPIGDMGGGPAKVGSYYTLDPGSPDVQEYLTSIVVELVSNYEIDGINLDYIRYVQTDAGYPADTSYPYSSLERFRRRTGFAGTPAPTGVPSWDDFRRETISELVRRLRAEIPSIQNPRQPLRLTADLITFGDAPSNGNFTSTSAYQLFQDWRLWMQRGWLDAGVPMNYKREHLSNQAQWYRNWVDAALGWRYDRHIFCGQATYLNTRANSVTQLSYSLNAGADGISTFSYDATADENLDGVPEADWGWYPFIGSGLFASVVPTPAMPWRDPATATEGTVWGRVTDQTTGEPIDGATVSIPGVPAVTTDGNGYYVLTLVPATAGGTTHTLTVTPPDPNCPGVSQDVTALAGQVARYDIGVCAPPPFGDFDGDGDVDAADFSMFIFCMQGPDQTFAPGSFCLDGDADGDSDADLHDFAAFQQSFSP